MGQDSGHILAVPSAQGLIEDMSVKLQYHLEAERGKKVPFPALSGCYLNSFPYGCTT